MIDEKALREAPYIVWTDNGEGWSPWPHQTIEEAVAHETYGSASVITKRCVYRVVEEEIPEIPFKVTGAQTVKEWQEQQRKDYENSAGVYVGCGRKEREGKKA